MIERNLHKLVGTCVTAFAIIAPAFLYLTFSRHAHHSNGNYPIRFVLPAPAKNPVAAVKRFAPADQKATENPTSLLHSSEIVSNKRSREEHFPNKSSVSHDLLMELEFDLSESVVRAMGPEQGMPVTVKKPMTLDGINHGDIQVYVYSDSRLAMDRGELRRLLAAAGKTDLSQGSPASPVQNIITFDDLRLLGLGIRYDPVADGILLSTARQRDEVNGAGAEN